MTNRPKSEVYMGVEQADTTSPVVLEDTDEQNVDTVDTAEAGADSSTETPDEGEKVDLLKVVQDAVSDTEDDDDPDSPTGQEENEASSEDGEDASEHNVTQETTELDNENYTDVPFHKHPRFKQLIAQRDQYKDGHEQYENIQGFLRQNGVSAEDAADALSIAALRKSDPEKAWEQLKPIAREILEKIGEVMPADLKERVDAGQLTAEDAREISRARAGKKTLAERQDHDRQLQTQRDQEQAARDRQNAAATWETNARTKDVDFDAKAEDLLKEINWLQRRDGIPKDPAGVKKQLDAAYDAVNKRIAPARQKKPAITPVRTNGASGGNAPAGPKSILDIVNAGGQV